MVFGERLPGKTSRELLEEFWAAGLDTLEFVDPGQTPAWSSPRYLPEGPYVQAWAPVKNAQGSVVGAVTIRRQADAVIFVTSTLRALAVASCIVFVLVLALIGILFKRKVTDRLNAIVRKIEPRPHSAETVADSVEETRLAISRALDDAQTKEQHLHRLLDGHSELACVATPEGTIIDANAAYCRFFGRTRGDLIGTSCLDLVKPEYRMDVVRHLRSLSGENPQASVIHPLTKADGSTAWVRWHAVAVPGPDGHTKEIISFGTDITPQMETEERLDNLRRAFDQMQSLAETGSLTWDFAAERMEWTPETRRLLGVDLSAPASLDGLLALVAPDDRETVRRLFHEAKEQGREFQHEFRTVLPDGSLRVLQSRAEVLADPKTKLLNHLTCTLRDITALRDAEAATKRELRFREAIEQSMGVGIVVSDDKGRNLLVNPAFCQMTGWSEKELIGITAPYPYWPEEEIPAITQAFDLAIAGNTPPAGFELKFCRKGGEHFDVLVKVAPLLDSTDKKLGWLGAVADISTLQNARRELSAAEKELRRELNYREAIEKSTTVGLIEIKMDGCPVSANDAYCQMLGYNKEEILAWKPPYPCWPDEERENIQRAFELHLQGKTPPEGFQIRLRKKNGTLFDVVITVSPVVGANGKQSGLLSALTDVTALQNARRELTSSNERMRIAQDVIEFGIWDWDPVGDMLFWDRNSFAIFGHPDATDPRAVWKVVHSEEEQERLTYELKRLVAAGGQSGQDKLRARWPDGSVHDILSTYVIIRDTQGKAVRVLGVNRDMTAELEEEQELLSAQERLAAALEGGSFGTFEHVFGVGALRWNAANYEIYGIDPSITDPNKLFHEWKAVVGPEYEALERKISGLPAGKNTFAYNFSVIVPRTGEKRRINSSVFVERNQKGHPVRLVGISRRID